MNTGRNDGRPTGSSGRFGQGGTSALSAAVAGRSRHHARDGV